MFSKTSFFLTFLNVAISLRLKLWFRTIVKVFTPTLSLTMEKVKNSFRWKLRVGETKVGKSSVNFSFLPTYFELFLCLGKEFSFSAQIERMVKQRFQWFTLFFVRKKEKTEGMSVTLTTIY